MLSTEFGEQAFNKWQNAETTFSINIDTENEPVGKTAQTDPATDENGDAKLNKDGQYESAAVTFYQKSIDRDRAEGSGKRWENASETEAYGAMGTHEAYHNESKQIKLDTKEPNELQQNRSKNLPINSEVNFRKEYHEKNPNQKNNKTWNQKYDQLGYNGIN